MENLQIALSNLSMSDLNEEYSFQHPYPQQFSLPYPIIKYMIQNPTGKAWKKLIQTCKYYYSKNPIFPVENLTAKSDEIFNADGEMFHANSILPSKLWLYRELYANSFSVSYTTVQTLLPKIYKCNLHSIKMIMQFLTWDQYQMLTSGGTVKQLILGRCSVKYSNGNIVPLEKLIENLNLLEYLNIACRQFFMEAETLSFFQPNTTKKMIQIFGSMKNLRFLQLFDLPETFDFFLLKKFIIKNEKIQIYLCYSNSSETQREMLDKFVDEIIQNPPAKVPYLFFSGFYGSKKYEKYMKVFNR